MEREGAGKAPANPLAIAATANILLENLDTVALNFLITPPDVSSAQKVLLLNSINETSEKNLGTTKYCIFLYFFRFFNFLVFRPPLARNGSSSS